MPYAQLDQIMLNVRIFRDPSNAVDAIYQWHDSSHCQVPMPVNDIAQVNDTYRNLMIKDLRWISVLWKEL